MMNELKVLWVVGAAERMATLGLISSNVPMQVTQDSIDDYLVADDCRDVIFSSDKEVAEIFDIMARKESEEDIDDEDMDNMIDLLLEFKNNRTNLVKYALCVSNVFNV